MAGSHPRTHIRRPLVLATVLVSTLVATTAVTVARAPGPAGADQVSSLKAQATAIAQKLVEEQLQVGAYQQQYSVASARTAAEARSIAQIGQQIKGDEQQIAARTALVRTQAIRSYMDYGTGTSSTDSALFSGNEETAQAASEYSSIAVGNITTALDQLRSARRTLQAQQTALRQQDQQNQVDLSHQATYLNQADGTEHQLTSLNSQVTGQLAAAVAQLAGARATAAAAAVAAAQRAAPSAPASHTGNASPSVPPDTSGSSNGASSQPTATTPATPTPVAPSTGVADPSLNSFLQCVVQAESGGDYGAVSPNGLYMGAFQFSQPTWNTAAQAAGLPSLVGVPPNAASKPDQDAVAVALFALDGEQPWLGDRCSA